MKRRLTINLEKPQKDETSETSDEESFELKTDTIRKALEGLGAKMFLGICIYMLLDTRRQVKITEAEHQCEC